PGATFFATGFFAGAAFFTGAAFFGAGFFGAGFFAGAAAFFAGFFAGAAFFGAAFFAAGFLPGALAGDFLAGLAAFFAGFFAATSRYSSDLPLRRESALLYPAKETAATAQERAMPRPEPVIDRLLIALLRGYKRWISPLLGTRCRFAPTC